MSKAAFDINAVNAFIAIACSEASPVVEENIFGKPAFDLEFLGEWLFTAKMRINEKRQIENHFTEFIGTMYLKCQGNWVVYLPNAIEDAMKKDGVTNYHLFKDEESANTFMLSMLGKYG